MKIHNFIPSVDNNCPHSETPGYLLDAVSPALPDSIPGPHVVSIFGQLVHHCFLRGGEFYKAQIHGGRLVSTGQLVTAKQTEKLQITHFVEILGQSCPGSSNPNHPVEDCGDQAKRAVSKLKSLLC